MRARAFVMSEPFYASRPPSWTPTTAQYFARRDLTGSTALADFRTSRKLYEGRYVTGSIPEIEQTEAILLGSLVDVMLTAKNELDEQFALTAATRRGTKAWRSEQEKNSGRELVKHELFVRANMIIHAVRKNPIAAGIMEGEGLSQVAHTWNTSGVPCRFRLDRLFGVKARGFADFKCLAVVRPDDVKRSVRRYGMARQFALYEIGFKDLWGFKPTMIMCVAHNVPPYEVATYNLNGPLLGDLMAKARVEVAEDLVELGKCLGSGSFENSWERELQ